MSEEMLALQRPILFDDSIAHCEIHAHQPYASATFSNNDEIRIAIQHQDLCLLPSKSSLHFYGRLTKTDEITPATSTKLVNNAICYLFEEIRYELNGVEIDRCKNVGLTVVMKNYISRNPNQTSLMTNAGWFKNDNDAATQLVDANGYFDVLLPLSMILGFAEDYRRIVINAKHELILIRSNVDTNAIKQTANEQFKITLNKVEWMVPYIRVSDERKIALLNFIAKDPSIRMSYRPWDMYEYPLLPRTSKHVWVIKTSTQLEKPRFVILGFQTKRKNIATESATQFDHCKIRDVKLFLNSQSYPYGNMNIDIAHNHYSILYDMYADFQSVYYGKESEPLLNKLEFMQYAPLIVIDCSKQNESLKSGPVDIRLEFESDENFPDQTSAYCMILHDRIVEYNPIGGDVKKLL